MLRICRNCYREYAGSPESTLCPDCVDKAKKTTICDRTCRACGTVFPGGPRAWYCPSCRIDRRREQCRAHQKTGPKRPLGSIDKCVICGSDYIVTSSRQKYCPGCAPAAIMAVDREQGRAWSAVNSNPEQRRQLRKAHAAPLSCVVCGNAFVPTDASKTCSPACRDELSRRNMQRYERTHRQQRNSQQNANRRKRLDAMSPEERESHRIATNRKSRENYRKRKEKTHD